MPKLPVISPKRLVKVLRRLGFEHIHGNGSHLFFAHPDGRKTVVSMHTGDLAKGTLNAILKDIHINREELNDLL